MATYSRPSSSSADGLSQRNSYLADLYDSDKDVGDLLAEGADVSDLIAADVLEDDDQPEGLETTEEFMARTESERQEISKEQTFLTPEEFQAEMEIGYRLLRRDYSNASSQPD